MGEGDARSEAPESRYVGRYGQRGSPGVEVAQRRGQLIFRFPGAPDAMDGPLEAAPRRTDLDASQPADNDSFRVSRGPLTGLPISFERGKSGALRRIEGPSKLQDVTYIDDAVRAHLLAGDFLLAGGAGADRINGHPYVVSSGEPVGVWEFMNELLEAAGVAPIQKSVSLKTALAVGWVFEKIHTLSGGRGDPRMSRWIVRQLTCARWFDISAARRDLRYEPRVSLEEGMRRLRVWLDEQAARSAKPRE